MATSATEVRLAKAQRVSVSEDTLTVDLTDGRTISVPIGWFPRLLHATSEERRKWRLVGKGEGIHWPELDEDVSVDDLLAGKPSSESQISLQRWLQERASRHRPTPS